MIPKKLRWQYLGKTNVHWVGMLPGEFPPVRFVLEKQSCERYLIKCNLDGVKDCTCTGLDMAKQQAQELLNGYALNFFEFNSMDKISDHQNHNQ